MGQNGSILIASKLSSFRRFHCRSWIKSNR